MLSQLLYWNVRSSDWWERTESQFSEDNWICNFRMSQETFEFFCHNVRSAMALSGMIFREWFFLITRNGTLLFCKPWWMEKADFGMFLLDLPKVMPQFRRSGVRCCMDAGLLTAAKQTFNSIISKVKVCRLKGKWRCLMKRNDVAKCSGMNGRTFSCPEVVVYFSLLLNSAQSCFHTCDRQLWCVVHLVSPLCMLFILLGSIVC